MKVILAVALEDAHVIGMLRTDEDEVVSINDWLFRREPGQYMPHTFKVYLFEKGKQVPAWYGTQTYPVIWENSCGKVQAHETAKSHP